MLLAWLTKRNTANDVNRRRMHDNNKAFDNDRCLQLQRCIARAQKCSGIKKNDMTNCHECDSRKIQPQWRLHYSATSRLLTFALDAEHQLSFVHVVCQFVRCSVVSVGTDSTIQFQCVRMEPKAKSSQWYYVERTSEAMEKIKFFSLETCQLTY